MVARCAWLLPPTVRGQAGRGAGRSIDTRRLAHDLAFLTTFLNTNYVLWHSMHASYRMKRAMDASKSVINICGTWYSFFGNFIVLYVHTGTSEFINTFPNFQPSYVYFAMSVGECMLLICWKVAVYKILWRF